MSGLVAAFSLLTRIPLARAESDGENMRRSVKWFPLVGGSIGVAIGAVYWGTSTFLPALLAGGIATLGGVLLTGAFHEDGLADTADAFGAGVGREETLRILKDPTHGTYGVLALITTVMVRVIAIAALPANEALAVLPVVHAMSRAGATGVMAVIPAATGDGLGAAHVGGRIRLEVSAGVASAALIGLALVGWTMVLYLVMATAGAGLVAILARRRLGGFTGDILGAAEQVNEVLLVVLAAAVIGAGWG